MEINIEQFRVNICFLHCSCVNRFVWEFVLEDDGSELDDDEVLLSLPPHTILMVLQNDQTWTPVSNTCIISTTTHHPYGATERSNVDPR